MNDLPVPRDMKEFHALFPDSGACVSYFSRVRWPDGYTCPKCGLPAKGIRKARGLICCKNDHQVSVTSGTALHRSKQPLWDWFYAAFLISTSPSGVSAAQLQKELGNRSYETVFDLLHRIRKVLVEPDRYPLRGEVEITRIDLCGTKVTIGVEVVRRLVDGQEVVRAGRMKATTTADLTAWAAQNITEGSTVQPEGRLVLPRVVDALRVWIANTHKGAVGERVAEYLGEFVFRFNRRHWKGPAFLRCLRLLACSNDLEHALSESEAQMSDHAARAYHSAPPNVQSWADANPERWQSLVDGMSRKK